MTTKGSTARRNWCLTTYELHKNEEWEKIDDSCVRLLSWQMEICPTTKRPHIQGYLELYAPARMCKVKAILSDNTVHLEARRGTRQQAYDYTKKEETEEWHLKYPTWAGKGARIPGTLHKQIGVFSRRQGERTDILAVVDAIDQGSNLVDIADNFPRQFIKYHAGISKLISTRSMRRDNKFLNTTVTVITGDAGIGKTRYVLDKYGPENVFSPLDNGTKFWFDGYRGQDVLLLNEYDWKRWGVEKTLQLLDKYAQKIEHKGGVQVSNWTKIYITTNEPVEEWFNFWFDVSPQHMRAMDRRITKIIEQHTIAEDLEGFINPLLTRKTIPFKEVAKDTVLPLATSVTKMGETPGIAFAYPSCNAGATPSPISQEISQPLTPRRQKN